MSPWDEAIASAREQFVDALEQRGFTFFPPDELSGSLTERDGTHRVTVRLSERFPFSPPSVHPVAEFPRSWHRELDGAMCLYPVTGREALSWLDADAFIELIGRWFEQTLQGWPDDAPDLDLNRYFYAADDDRLVLYDDLAPLVGRYIRLRANRHTITILGAGGAPAKSISSPKRAFGYVADIGEPAVPPHDWTSLSALIDPADVHALDKAIRERRIEYVLVTYQRQDSRAVVALEAHDTVEGIQLRSLASAPADPATLRLRSGHDAAGLAEADVLILGAGSVGSFLADALQRAGVGKMTIRDGDILRPGNLVRHLAGPEYVGQSKASAVAATLGVRPFNATEISTDSSYLSDPAEVLGLLEGYDLVIDATADAAVTPMINTAALTTDHPVLNVCVKDEGRLVRVDVVPPPPGTDELPETAVAAPDPTTLVFEAGCGDPVSLTPPYTVAEAAQLAARFAVAMLLGRDLMTSGEVRDYRATR